MNVHIQTVDRTKLGSRNYLPIMERSLRERLTPETVSRVRYIVGDSGLSDDPSRVPCSEEDLAWMAGKPLQFKCSVNYLRSLKAARPGEPALIFEDDVILTTRFEDKLQALLASIPTDEFVLSLYSCQRLRFRPLEQVRPEQYWGCQAMYFPASLVPRLRDFMEAKLPAWTPGDPVNDVACDMIIQRFCAERSIPIYLPRPSLVQHIGMKSTGLNPFAKQHTAPVFYEGRAKSYERHAPESFCSFVTEELVFEELLLLKSLSLFHPETPVYVLADFPSARLIRKEFPKVRVFVGINEKAIAERKRLWMINPENARLRGKRDPFLGKMFFKIEAVELALEHHANTVFCDADTLFLHPLPPIPDCDLAMARHCHDPKAMGRDLEYGIYNAGLVYVGNRDFPAWWRNAYVWRSHYSDQGCFDEASERFDLHVWPDTVNFGHWRLWNHSVGYNADLETADAVALCRFAGITVGGGIFLHGQPLQSVHIHMLSDISRLHPANRALKRLMEFVLTRSASPAHQHLAEFCFRLDERWEMRCRAN